MTAGDKYFILFLQERSRSCQEGRIYLFVLFTKCTFLISEFVEEMCFIPCPRDCELSEWTDWTECQLTSKSRCGLGVQTRSRYLIETGLDGGRECPALKDDEVGLQTEGSLQNKYVTV